MALLDSEILRKEKHQATITFRTQTNNNDNNNSIKVAEHITIARRYFTRVLLAYVRVNSAKQPGAPKRKNEKNTKTTKTKTTTKTTTTTITQLPPSPSPKIQNKTKTKQTNKQTKQKQTNKQNKTKQNKTNRKLYAAPWHSTLKGLVALLRGCGRFA